MKVLDVVLAQPGGRGAAYTVSRQIDLGHNVAITPISDVVVDYIVSFCEPHRLHTTPHRLGSSVRFAFVRHYAEERSPSFDHDERLLAALAVSRLVKPHSTGFELSARLFLTGDPETIDEATTGPFKGPAAFAFVAAGLPDGISDRDAGEIAKLFDQYWTGRDALPERVTRSFWRLEYAARSEYLEIRFLFVVSAIEALLKTGRNRTTKQFVDRTLGLAARYPSVKWSDADAKRAYGLRSEMAHGHKVTSEDPDLAMYIELEKLARFALIESITTPTFADVFREDEAITITFPMLPDRA